MTDYLKYRKSISKELISIKDRVRDFIDDRHWGEDGRYKEIILSDKIKDYLPQKVLIGTGFVMCDENITTSQIDIIIYRSDFPVLFKKDNFVIVPKESVLGIIEVKTKLNSSNIRETIKKSHENGVIIGNKIFNGIFSYECEFEFKDKLAESISSSLNECKGFINNISFGKDIFLKFWPRYQPSNNYRFDHYSFYKIEDLAFGYFISNLIEDVHIQYNGNQLPATIESMLYPIENTKEVHRLSTLEITFEQYQ